VVTCNTSLQTMYRVAHILLAFVDGYVTETCGPIQDRTVVVALNGLKLVSPRVLSNLGGCVERASVISYQAEASSFFRYGFRSLS